MEIIALLITVVGALIFFIKWLMSNVSKKDNMIEKMSERSLTALNNNTIALNEIQRLLKKRR